MNILEKAKLVKNINISKEIILEMGSKDKDVKNCVRRHFAIARGYGHNVDNWTQEQKELLNTIICIVEFLVYEV